MNTIEYLSFLMGHILRCIGIALGSLIVYVIIGFFSGFTAAQWGIWFWVAILWPFVLTALFYVFSRKNKDNNQILIPLTEEQKRELEEYNKRLNQ